ncbi:MAG: hypothetical protein RIQ57_124 [Pseudomonadota bacterium]
MGKKIYFLLQIIDKFLWTKKWITSILRNRIANYRYLKFNNGGAGGNRTPVRESSADSSTYLAYYLI